MAERKASDIAKWFVNRYIDRVDSGESDEYMTPLKLQKLLYYAQGCFLAFENRPLFVDEIEAWKHGPVVSKIYFKYEQFGKECPYAITKKEEDIPAFATKEEAVLLLVDENFGQYSGWQLRDMTHEEAPWKDVFVEGQKNIIIEKDDIKKFFLENVVELDK